MEKAPKSFGVYENDIASDGVAKIGQKKNIGAYKNLDAEIPHRYFGAVRTTLEKHGKNTSA